ncbi:MAG TPA: hypothetical protein VKF36_21480 [Syntrophorhabdales bacterium]|nr:hypothetical protein [Syntrophorhabdales bacterium]
MPDEREALFENQPLEKGADTVAGGEPRFPVDQWAKAEFLVCLTKAQTAVAKATEQTARHYRGFLRELALLIEHF